MLVFGQKLVVVTDLYPLCISIDIVSTFPLSLATFSVDVPQPSNLTYSS